MLNRHFSRSCSDPIYSKSIKKNRIKVPFLKVYHFAISQHFFNCKGVSCASSDRIIYFSKIKVGMNLFICQIMTVNKVYNFPSFLPNVLLKISASV